MVHVLWQAFYWPGGVLVGNLLASLIWDSLTTLPQHRKTRKHIEKHVKGDHGSDQ